MNTIETGVIAGEHTASSNLQGGSDLEKTAGVLDEQGKCTSLAENEVIKKQLDWIQNERKKDGVQRGKRQEQLG